jgi:hypothetical protein
MLQAGAGFTNRVSRAINRTVLNFGFSGSGHMDLGIGMWLLKIDAAVFIIDCNWNMRASEIALKTAPLVRQLRAARPEAPIILAEGTPDGLNWVLPSDAPGHQEQNNQALRAAYAGLKADGVPNLHYVESASLFAAGDALQSNIA